MARIVIVGGGIAGCAAALAAVKAGAEASIVERTDRLGGASNYAGFYRENGRFVAAEEAIALGAGELFEIMDSMVLHRIDLLHLKHMRVYDVFRWEQRLRELIHSLGIEVHYRVRGKSVRVDGNRVKAVELTDGSFLEGDVFVETTGSGGTLEQCRKYGFGCVQCYEACPTFGSRISLADKAGAAQFHFQRKDGTPGGIGAGFFLLKESLNPEIQRELNSKGFVLVPIPAHLVDYKKFENITATHNVYREQIENLCIIDNGYAKVRAQMYMPLKDLRSIPGMETACYVQPQAGGVGNHARGFDLVECGAALEVAGLANLFAAGSKCGFDGVTEALTSGLIAGHNAVRLASGMELLVLPSSIAIGDFVAFMVNHLRTREIVRQRHGFAGPAYFKRLCEIGLYTTDRELIHRRVAQAGVSGILGRKIV